MTVTGNPQKRFCVQGRFPRTLSQTVREAPRLYLPTAILVSQHCLYLW
jgi:hypothetical protein